MIKKYISYLRDNPKGYWFKRKVYGWGWTPATWQGWFITILYITLIVLLTSTLDPESSVKEVLSMFVLPVVLLTISFVRIAYKKGQSPKWQWGNWGDE